MAKIIILLDIHAYMLVFMLSNSANKNAKEINLFGKTEQIKFYIAEKWDSAKGKDNEPRLNEILATAQLMHY